MGERQQAGKRQQAGERQQTTMNVDRPEFFHQQDEQPQDVGDAAPTASTTVTIANPLGLHLRQGKEVVRIANRYRCQLLAQNLTRESGVVNAKSILQLMQLQARQGHTLRFWASGPDSAEALQALKRFLEEPPAHLGPTK